MLILSCGSTFESKRRYSNTQWEFQHWNKVKACHKVTQLKKIVPCVPVNRAYDTLTKRGVTWMYRIYRSHWISSQSRQKYCTKKKPWKTSKNVNQHSCCPKTYFWMLMCKHCTNFTAVGPQYAKEGWQPCVLPTGTHNRLNRHERPPTNQAFPNLLDAFHFPFSWHSNTFKKKDAEPIWKSGFAH